MPLAVRGTDELIDPDHSRIEPVGSHRRAWVLAISSLAIVIVLAVAAYRYSPAIGTPSPTALDYSVSREVGAGWMSSIQLPCVRRSSQTWRCGVWDSEFSGSATYIVAMDGSRCWNARLVGGSASAVEGGPLKDPASGCVMLSDQLRLFSRIF